MESTVLCTKNKNHGPKKLLWDGNPEGIIAFQCQECGEYEYDGEVFGSYDEAMRNYEKKGSSLNSTR